MQTNPERTLREEPPEPSAWFEDLSDEQREEILCADGARLDRWKEIQRTSRQAWNRPMLEGAAVLGLCASFCTFMSPAGIAAASVAGALCGWVWHRFQTGPLLSMVIAVLFFEVGLGIAGQLTGLALLVGPAPIAVASYFIGERRVQIFPH